MIATTDGTTIKVVSSLVSSICLSKRASHERRNCITHRVRLLETILPPQFKFYSYRYKNIPSTTILLKHLNWLYVSFANLSSNKNPFLYLRCYLHRLAPIVCKPLRTRKIAFLRDLIRAKNFAARNVLRIKQGHTGTKANPCYLTSHSFSSQHV